MQATSTLPERISFGPFSLWPRKRTLLRDNEPVRLGDRALDVLMALLECPGVVQTNEALTLKVWNRQWLDESNLRVAVSAIRKALDDRQYGYIQNVPGQGYCFSGDAEIITWSSQRAGDEPASSDAVGDWPAHPAKVIGRDCEIGSILRLLDVRQLVTIVGTAGIGKTTVALSVAKAWGRMGKVRVVDLSGVSSLDTVSRRVASALGASQSQQGATSWLRDYASSEPVLLILDNCEHVAEATACTIEQILWQYPSARILATSREPLRITHEAVFRLDGLDYPARPGGCSLSSAAAYPAVELFMERVKATCPTLPVPEQFTEQACEICRRLDGIPLAIELAANRIAALGIDGVAEGISDRFELLTRGYRTAPERHRTLKAAIGWSYDLLDPMERTVLWRLSTLSGIFTLASAARIIEAPISIAASLLANLVDKSLVMANAPYGNGSYYLLETIRAFVLDRLREAGEAEQYTDRKKPDVIVSNSHILSLGGREQYASIKPGPRLIRRAPVEAQWSEAAE